MNSACCESVFFQSGQFSSSTSETPPSHKRPPAHSESPFPTTCLLYILTRDPSSFGGRQKGCWPKTYGTLLPWLRPAPFFPVASLSVCSRRPGLGPAVARLECAGVRGAGRGRGARGAGSPGGCTAARRRGPGKQSSSVSGPGVRSVPRSPPSLAPCPDTRAVPSPSQAGWGAGPPTRRVPEDRETEREKCLPGQPLSLGPPRPPFPVFLPVTRPRLRGRGGRKRRGRSGSGRGVQRRGRALGFLACWGRPGVPAAPAAWDPCKRHPAGAAGLVTPSARWPWLVLSPVGGGRRTCSGPNVDCRAARGGKCLIKPQLCRPDRL